MTSTTPFVPDISIRSSNWLFVTYFIVVGGTRFRGVEDLASDKVLVEVSSPGQCMHISLSFDACAEAFEHVHEVSSISLNLDRISKLARNKAAMTHLGEAIGSIKTIGTLEFKSLRDVSGAAEVSDCYSLIIALIASSSLSELIWRSKMRGDLLVAICGHAKLVELEIPIAHISPSVAKAITTSKSITTLTISKSETKKGVYANEWQSLMSIIRLNTDISELNFENGSNWCMDWIAEFCRAMEKNASVTSLTLRINATCMKNSR